MTSATRILGYVDPLICGGGDQVAVKLSCDDIAAYQAEVVRLICADPDSRGPGLRYEAVVTIAPIARPGRPQAIHPGSFVRIDDTGPLRRATRFAFAAMVFPTLLDGHIQTIASLWEPDNQQGYAIGLDESGALAARIGDGTGAVATLSTATPLLLREWSYIAVWYDNDSGRLELIQACLADFPGMATKAARQGLSSLKLRGFPTTPFMLAAEARRSAGGHPVAGRAFNGKIERPRIAEVSIAPERLRALVESDDSDAGGDEVIAAWDFAVDITTARVHDRGPHGLHGTTVNCPARGMTGYNWDGSSEDWRSAPMQYGAIHFHDDDLYDCRWDTDFEIALPTALRSGYYAVRVTAPGCETFVPFFVSARCGAPTAPVVVVAATATYLAYANTHVKFDSLNSENLFESVMQVSEQEDYLNSHRELGYSTYDVHADGSGVFYSSWLRPLLTVQPGLYTFNYVNDSHLLAWLENLPQPYDVITDHDLHRHGQALLANYRVVITGSHPEYFSTAMWDALFTYQQQGGRHIYLGGNGFYWRTGFNIAFPAAIEMRRGITGVRTWEGEPGEGQLGFTGEPSGLWRSLGRAPQRLCGVGFSATIFNRSTYYIRTAQGRRADLAFIFAGVADDAHIGDFGLRGGGAAGLEIDRWDPVLGSPPNGVVVATSEGIGIGGLLTVEEFITTTRALDAEQNGKVRADICIFATPGGGAVFSVGSIAWPTSLMHATGDNNVARITANVLRRFLDPEEIVIAQAPEAQGPKNRG